MGTTSTNLGLSLPTVNGDVDTWGTQLNATLALLDRAVQFGLVTKTLTNADVTLSVDEACKEVINLSGALTANVNLIIPATPARGYIVVNGTTGAFTVTVKTAAGTGVLVPQNANRRVYSNGTNILFDIVETAANQSGGTVNATTGSFSGNLTVTGTTNTPNVNATTSLALQTGGTTKATITNGGNVLLGTTSEFSNARLYVVANGNNVAARFYGTAVSDSQHIVYFDKPSTTTSTSQVFVGFTVNGQAAGSGQINANGASQAAFGSFSDRRLKENIVDLPPQLDNILALRPVEFDYIESEGGGHQVSFIAQEFEEVYPDAVGSRSDGMKTLTGWGKTEARLVKAIQEQQAMIAALESRLAALEAK